MKRKLPTYTRNTVIFLFLSIIIIMMTATVVEKLFGTDFVSEKIYSSPWFMSVWILASIASTIYIFCKKWTERLITLLIHFSFLIILSGALITHIFGVQGHIHLRIGESYTDTFTVRGKENHRLPFNIMLEEFHVENYAGTQSAIDYVSKIKIEECGQTTNGTVSMNNIFEYRSYRFYQSGFDRDRRGSTLSIYYDPYGISITYAGYMSLFLSLLFFFREKTTNFKKFTKSKILKISCVSLFLLLFSVSLYAGDRAPKTIPVKTAEKLGELYVYYNGRICPLQTLAYDFTIKICGKKNYKGLTPQQIMAGYFFFYDNWKDEPFIRIKSKYVQKVLDTGKYASINDFIGKNGFKIEEAISTAKDPDDIRALEEANEKFNIISMLCTGNLLKIYPVYNLADNSCKWYSMTDKLPDNISHDKWAFLKYGMNYVSEQIYSADYAEAEVLLDKIKKYQENETLNGIPSDLRFKAEIFYNWWVNIKFAAMLCLVIGLLAFAYQTWLVIRKLSTATFTNTCLNSGMYILLLYILSVIVLRGIISCHFPVSNGFETMLFMAAATLVLTLAIKRQILGYTSFGYLICGLSLLVAMFGESNPAITPLMPVLSSPLLSIHVMTIMISYSLFAIMMFNGITAEIIYRKGNSSMEPEIEKLETISRILSYPAVFLLATGIFIGAVWANVSWGRYWGWDPKEVWALITLLVYSSSLHTESLSSFRNTMFFHRFCIVAFGCVIITYFGVNFILGGMHSYA